MLPHLIISKGTELLRFPLDKIVFISSDGNYSNLTTVDNRIIRIMSSMTR